MTTTRILIVDDHPAMRHGLGQLIENEVDLEVCGETEDRETALAAVRRLNPDFAVINIALRDRTASDLDLIPEIRAVSPRILMLVVSMHDETLYAERALRAGARGYLMKQEPVREIITAIRQIVAGGIHLSDVMNQNLLLRHVGAASRPAAADIDPVEDLSLREFEVFRLIGKGLQPRLMADNLHVSTKTVESHRLNIRRKLDLADAAELTRFAVEWVHRKT
ncbi:MAG: response regulator transcription factor [Deltaproteobacteria bacterium]|nr:response regulator transcription factor [Candidatus Anaeroferrophillacea bacterium]